MSAIKFEKWHGIGNTYLLIRQDDLPTGADGEYDLAAAHVAVLCDQHFGAGSDGILVIGSSTIADARMRIHNPDGSMAEMCGNGIRMAARYLHKHGLIDSEQFTIETAAGVMRPQLVGADTVRVDMGRAVTDGRETIELPSGDELTGRIVSMGNPHFVIDMDPATALIEQLGPAAEHHPRFPNRSNIEFIRIGDAGDISMRVWERGVGETLACGTGACAVGVTALLDHGVTSPMLIHLPGGDLTIEVGDDLHVHMTGSATHIYTGSIDPAAILAASPYANHQEITA